MQQKQTNKKTVNRRKEKKFRKERIAEEDRGFQDKCLLPSPSYWSSSVLLAVGNSFN